MNKQAQAYLWLTTGVKLYNLMKSGRYATAAHIVKVCLDEGVFKPDDEEGSDWRTAILLNYALHEI